MAQSENGINARRGPDLGQHRRRMTSYERSLRDLDEGRVYEAKDVDDLFKQCLG